MFRLKAEEFHARPRPGETKREKKERLDQKALNFVHLENEAKHLETLGAIFANLEEYRNGARGRPGETIKHGRARSKRVGSEKHHPTDDLEDNLRAIGRTKPSGNHSAHHIVPGKGRLAEMKKVRIKMHLLNIPINDSDNGAWMLKTKAIKAHHWFAENAHAHKEIHTHNYERWIKQKVDTSKTEASLRVKLREVGLMLEQGNEPKECSQSPIPGWPS